MEKKVGGNLIILIMITLIFSLYFASFIIAEEVKINPKTKVLSEETLKLIVSCEDWVFVFSDTNEEIEALSPGDIIAGGSSNCSEEGFLRKVSGAEDIIIQGQAKEKKGNLVYIIAGVVLLAIVSFIILRIIKKRNNK